MANNPISLRSLLEKEKLNGINFLDWFRNLRIVLKHERKEYVIEEPVPDEPAANAPRANKDKFKKHMDDMVDVGCLMLATMNSEFQKQNENMVAYEMIQNLKEIYEGKARQERYETSKALFKCKMTEGTPVGAHVIKMMGYIQTLEKLGDMNKGGSKSILVVREAKRKEKKVAKSKGNGKTKAKGKNALKPKDGISKDGKCFHCEKSGHWKRNCPVYLEEVKKAKAVGASVSESTWQSIKALRSDRGGEYLNQDLDELLKECGIVSQLTPPGTPQWNGVSEMRNRTLLDMVQSMMSHSDLPISFRGHALETAGFTLNRVPSKSVQKTPYEIWTGKHPKTKGYYFYNPKENKVFVARTGVFLEKEFLSSKRDRRNIKLEELQQQQVTKPEVEQTSQIVEENSTNLETQPLRRSTRELHEPERYGFLVTSHGDIILVDQDEPKTYQEAVSSLDSEKWLEAMRSEMDSMSNNQVWTLVEPPEGIKPIGCKWVFKKKTDMDGNVQTYKGRLVAKGEEQLSIKGYTDASLQTDKDDSRSQSGFVFCLNGGAVSWKSSKQDTVADSTTEAEYIAASEAAKEAVWIKKFVTELGVVPNILDAMELYCDNNGAIAQAKEPRSHQRSKHILRRFHLIREIIDRGDVEICKVHTDDNIADPTTKPLTQQKHDRHTESLGITYVSDWS
ncbi:hypothetical protein V6N12_045668 [Hibiscus sabdariffa]|uniref:Uncharacterized protein n=1 Tax=Hibiscus sabdariffa TaxID=183260 RepID=A0ABR2G3I9_9ROSI